MRLSLIVPCFNEQDNIFPFARAVAEVFPDPSDYEIVFVNDGSKDKTLQNLKELHRQSRQNIRVVSFSRNFGKESAIYAGLQHCDGEYISLIDADLQQDPAIVKQMTEILDAEPDTDCVCAFQETRHENNLTDRGVFIPLLQKKANACGQDFLPCFAAASSQTNHLSIKVLVSVLIISSRE
jgi:glucosyltransferase